MTDLTIYDFEGLRVRTFLRAGGVPWWFLTDVSRALEVGNPSDVARRLDEDEKDTLDLIELRQFTGLATNGSRPVIINESGLYSVIMSSRKECAVRFKRWLAREVLPSIRKTGSYSVVPETPEALALRALQSLMLTVEQQKAEIEVQQFVVEKQKVMLDEAEPKARALDRIATAQGSMTMTNAAKVLQMRPTVLKEFLLRRMWVYRRKPQSPLVGYQNIVESGYLEHKVNTFQKPDGSDANEEQVRITSSGLTRLAQIVPADLRGEF